MRRLRLASTLGQAATEWLGVVVLVAALALVLMARSDAIGQALGGGVRTAICSMTDEDCPATGPGRLDSPARTLGEPQALKREVGDSLDPDEVGCDDKARRVTITEDRRHRICEASDGVYLSCEPYSAGGRLDSDEACSDEIETRALRDRAACASAPNERIHGTWNPVWLCQITRDDGSTAMLRCVASEPAGSTSAGRTHRRCTNTDRDSYAVVPASATRCHGSPRLQRIEDAGNRSVVRFTGLCTSWGGSAYACWRDLL